MWKGRSAPNPRSSFVIVALSAEILREGGISRARCGRGVCVVLIIYRPIDLTVPKRQTRKRVFYGLVGLFGIHEHSMHRVLRAGNIRSDVRCKGAFNFFRS